MTRALRFAAAVTLLLTVALLPSPAPAGAERTADLRARRADALARIAALADEVDREQVRVVMAQSARRQADADLRSARRVLARRALDAYVGVAADRAGRAVDAYVEGAASPVTSIGLQRALNDSRRHVATMRRARARAESEQAAAETARDRVRRAATELDALRAQLEAGLAREEALDAEARAAVAARRAGMAAADARADAELRAAAGRRLVDPDRPGPYLDRHRRATARQNALMARHPFGPVAGVPEGLRPTGQVVAGLASWYGPGFDGRGTASGAIYDQEAWTTAHRSLPFGTMLLVTRGPRSVLLLVNDRGPYPHPGTRDRVLDLSHAAAAYLGVGLDEVSAEVVVPT